MSLHEMKAAVRYKYGPPEVLSIKEMPIPAPKENEVLVKVHAATVNRTDCGILTGKPFLMKFFTGLSKPRIPTTGSDFAGDIVATGGSVKSFKPGDRVMGFNGLKGTGSHAEYLVVPENRIITIPGMLSYHDAAASIEGAFYASVVFRKLNLEAGQNALVIGGTGAIGSAFVQYFANSGIWVTAVCGGENAARVRGLGARRIIDYKTEDFKNDPERYDYVIDAVGKSSFATCKQLLKEKGIYSSSDGFENIFLAKLTPFLGGKRVLFTIPRDLPGGLNFIRSLIEKGSFKPLIDRTYPLEKIAEAFTYVATGQKTGNVIITMNGN
jgi:NADPH:quinone reductase-like Zn-dependent oxidoreductase